MCYWTHLWNYSGCSPKADQEIKTTTAIRCSTTSHCFTRQLYLTRLQLCFQRWKFVHPYVIELFHSHKSMPICRGRLDIWANHISALTRCWSCRTGKGCRWRECWYHPRWMLVLMSSTINLETYGARAVVRDFIAADSLVSAWWGGVDA